nr:SpoVR family protein [Bacillus cereus group sp. BfR-BA-01310]
MYISSVIVGKPIRKKKKIPPQPEKDLLLFIEEYSRELEEWQCDILTMMREEMLHYIMLRKING